MRDGSAWIQLQQSVTGTPSFVTTQVMQCNWAQSDNRNNRQGFESLHYLHNSHHSEGKIIGRGCFHQMDARKIDKKRDSSLTAKIAALFDIEYKHQYRDVTEEAIESAPEDSSGHVVHLSHLLVAFGWQHIEIDEVAEHRNFELE